MGKIENKAESRGMKYTFGEAGVGGGQGDPLLAIGQVGSLGC
jgi:hypothetical protein